MSNGITFNNSSVSALVSGISDAPKLQSNASDGNWFQFDGLDVNAAGLDANFSGLCDSVDDMVQEIVSHILDTSNRF